jgi:hypothetical protein
MMHPMNAKAPEQSTDSTDTLQASPPLSPAGEKPSRPAAQGDRWVIEDNRAIRWDIHKSHLPHRDHIEMSGRLVSVVLDYGADAKGHFSIQRRIIWPTLRRKPKDVRGYLKRTFDDGCLPAVTLDGKPVPPIGNLPVSHVRLDGIFTVVHRPWQGLEITRQLLPSGDKRAIIEYCTAKNTSSAAQRVGISGLEAVEQDAPFTVRISSEPSKVLDLAPGESVDFAVVFYAGPLDQTRPAIDPVEQLHNRRQFLNSIEQSLVFQCPSPVLTTAFAFAKIRAAESVFDTKMGLVHSPGGERYYGGIWANDQAEYAGPFFPFLGDAIANEASLNAYRIFASATTPEYKPLPASFEVEGDVRIGYLDRGDAAMVAYGATRFALASGSRQIGEELWPLVEWCLEYCNRLRRPDGVIASTSDELENRFPSGDANLSTSSLTYGALLSAGFLAHELGHESQAAEYDRRATDLRAAIESHFGANVEGYESYRYFDGNTVLRAWICIPLTMGILDRATETRRAIFSHRLWSADGLATEAGRQDFWDRSTLYALRGVLAAGADAEALSHFQAFSRRRLLGDHVPYAVEAFPEGGQAHLSAESALYCRIVIEGLFGIVPTGFRTFTATPHLPAGWPEMRLNAIKAFGHSFDLIVTATAKGRSVSLVMEGQVVQTIEGSDGDACLFALPGNH